MNIFIAEAAKDDLIDGFRFYEKQEEGLGDYFLTNLYTDIESLKILGGIHPKPYGELHRSLSKKVPVCDLLWFGRN